MAYYSHPQSEQAQQETLQASFMDHFEPSKSTEPLQHFVEWFSGDSLDSIWSQRNITGTGTYAMVDAIDEGFSIKSGASNSDESMIWFNDINHYSHAGSVIIGIFRRVTASTFASFGFTDDQIASGSDHISFVDDTADSLKTLFTANGSSQGSTNMVTSVDTIFHNIKMELDGSNAFCHVDGILEATRTSQLPDTNMQPNAYVFARTAGAKEAQIRYLEAYNT